MPDVNRILDRLAQAAVEAEKPPRPARSGDNWFAAYTGEFNEARAVLTEAGLPEGDTDHLLACIALAKHESTATERETAGKPVTRATRNAITYLKGLLNG